MNFFRVGTEKNFQGMKQNLTALLLVLLGGCSDRIEEKLPEIHYEEFIVEVEAPNLGGKGLVNLGTTCYMNSLLQVLMHAEAVRDAVFALPEESIRNNRFLANMSSLFEAQWQGDGDGPIRPIEMFRYLNRQNPEVFTKNVQQDANEAFLLFENLMKAAHESLDLFTIHSNRATACENGDRSMISDPTPELNLQVPRPELTLNGSISLEELVQDTLQPESVPGIESCKGSAGRRVLEIVDLPRLLVFALNRNDNLGTKVQTAVRFPDEISGALLGPNQNELDRYRLVGIINHMGTHVSSGHYTAHVFLNGEWWNANDSEIFKLKSLSHESRKATMLFYQRIVF
jgi:ubiquitin carboxyl-terminal hydrolase 22/27/51